MAIDERDAGFVERLEGYLLEGSGDLPEMREELAVRVEESRFLGHDARTEALEALQELLATTDDPDDGDVLPLIFALRDSYEEPRRSGKGDGTPDIAGHRDDGEAGLVDETDHPGDVAEPDRAVLLEIDDDDRELLSRSEETIRLLREARQTNRDAYIVELEAGSARPVEIVEAIEAEFAVIRSVLGERSVRVLVVSELPPSLKSITSRIALQDGAYEGRVRPVDLAKVLDAPSVAQRWYERLPGVRLKPPYEVVERLEVLVRELESVVKDDNAAVVRELRAAVDRSLTVDLRRVFEEMEPAMETLGRELRKHVRVRVMGDSESVPARYADTLREHIFELVVNAIQHGIEPAEERRARGKDVYGTVRVFLRNTAGRLVIRIHDDGRGVSQDDLRRAAGRNAHGGLSSVRESVTERFGGTLTLKSSDRGTTAEIDLPFRRGIYRGVVFVRDDTHLVAPATFVTETVELTPQSLVADAADAPFVRVGGRVVPFSSLGSDRLPSPLMLPAKWAVVIRLDGTEVAVAADAIVGEAPVLPRPDSTEMVDVDQINEEVYRIPLKKG